MKASPFDVAVVGGGPAGLSAALTLGRAGRRVILLDSGRYRNAPAAHSHGVLTRDGIPPAELREAGRAEARGYGVEFVDASVRAASRDGGLIRLDLDDDRIVEARAAVVATGVVDELPDVPGLEEAWGAGAVHCPYCHGYEHRGKPTAVLGRGESTYEMARLLRGWTDDVTVLTNGPEDLDSAMEADLARRRIRIVRTSLRRLIVSAGEVCGVEFEDGDVLECGVLYVKPPQRPATTLAKDLGAAVDDDGRVVADPDGRTDAPGVFVAGDIVSKTPQQIVNAMAGGHHAAIAINHDLVCGS